MARQQWTARAAGLSLAAAGLFVGLCLLTYSPRDVALLSYPPNNPSSNLGGTVGVWIGFLGRGGFGFASFLLPLLALLWGVRLWRGALAELHGPTFTIATVALLTSAGTLLALPAGDDTLQANLGGLVGFFLADRGAHYLGAGAWLAAGLVGLLSWMVVSGQTLRRVSSGLSQRIGQAFGGLLRRPATAGAGLGAVTGRPESGVRVTVPPAREDAGPALPPGVPRGIRIRSTVEPKPKVIPTPPRRQSPGGFQLPGLDLLANPPPLSERQINDDLQKNGRVLQETLLEFGVETSISNIDRGPTVTRYELTPAPGVKLNRIVSLADDLALVMKAASVHIVAPIPGKGTVGVDVPNGTSTVVYLKEIVTAHEFSGNPSPLALPIGKDVSGNAIVVDLRECPHLLIAGATGSGKTVCLNSVLIGILTHASPEQVKFLMIDPKMVELAMFNDIPHLVAPVVTNAKKAGAALHWAVSEMERRYQLLSRAGARNIEGYNKKIATSGPVPAPKVMNDDGTEGEDPLHDDGRPLPYLVIVIDELADLMMIASQEVEGAIARLAQLSRAVGLHIILATQRPSVDVITGVIKANFPARLAFQVASKVDSRTILDANGADKLLGRGDLLFLPPGAAKPIRAQGAYVSDGEIEQITNYLKQQRPPTYDERLLERARQPEGMMPEGEKDEMYETAKQLVLDTGQASTSLLQRRLRLGYGRAARMLDLMEQEGLVGPPQGSRPREVLVSRVSRGGVPPS